MMAAGELREHSLPIGYMLSYLYACVLSYLTSDLKGVGKVHIVHKFTALAREVHPKFTHAHGTLP